MAPHPLSPLLGPLSVAIFGASDRRDWAGGIVCANLRAGGFPGRIVPINPKHRNIDGVPCQARIVEVGGGGPGGRGNADRC